MKFSMSRFLREEELDDRRVATPEKPREDAPAVPGSRREADDLEALQRAAGNRTVWRLLGPECTEADGRALEAGVRHRMEGALGADLSDVRVHTGEEAASEVRRHGAEALALGRHIAFERGRYRPGTPIGDAVLAHELAHTIQQQDAQRGRGRVASHRLEADAHRSALGAVGALWGGAMRGAATAARTAGPRLRSGTQMQFLFCESEPAFETPDYLGEHSRQTVEHINERLRALRALGPWVAVGTAVTVGFGPPSDPTDTVTAAAGALRGLPVLARAAIVEEVSYLKLDHGDELNAQEREFWDAVMREVSQR